MDKEKLDHIHRFYPKTDHLIIHELIDELETVQRQLKYAEACLEICAKNLSPSARKYFDHYCR